MKKNRKVSKRQSAFASHVTRCGVVLIAIGMMVILNILSSTSCTMLMKKQGELERQLEKLTDVRTQEATRWEMMKSPEKVEMALLKSGLKMQLPHPVQNVRIGKTGVPYPGQISVARAKQRMGGEKAQVNGRKVTRW